MIVLGISAFFHDSAAALVIDGHIVAAAQEERFSRIKNDASFPERAIAYVLEEGGVSENELSAVAFYEKPLLKFERLLETYHVFAPKGLASFLKAMPIWLKEKLFLKRHLKKHLKSLKQATATLYFPEHHLSHSASAFFPSPFEEATILTVDGVGEWASLTIGYGKGNSIKVLRELHFPHSLGLLYSSFTYFLGFEVNKGEYKLMGLAAYGELNSEQTKRFIETIWERFIDLREDGSFLLNMAYFKFATQLRMVDDYQWEQLIGIKKRSSEDRLLQSHANLALAIQKVTETILCKIVTHAIKLTNIPKLVMAGGVALNGVANAKIQELDCVEDLWIQPAAGDSGGALGAALAVTFIDQNSNRLIKRPDSMQGAYLGPEFSRKDVLIRLRSLGDLKYASYPDVQDLLEKVCDCLAKGMVVGWFQGRMEFGPRALGNRSIIADPRHPEMQSIINSKIKFRESFRPFAPSMLAEDVSEYYISSSLSPYMLLVKNIKKERRVEVKVSPNDDLLERLSHSRSDLPGITHVDYSSRIHTVEKSVNPLFHELLSVFKKKTGYGVLINTSFNVKDEPIVATPEDAIKCFQNTKMDILVIDNLIIEKT